MGWWKTKWESVGVSQNSNAVVAIFSGLLFVTTVFYTFIACGQLNMMKLSERPWVGIREITVESVTYDGGPTRPVFRLRYHLENVGHSPAFTRILPKIMIEGENWPNQQASACDKTGIERIPVYTILPSFPMSFDRIYDRQSGDVVRIDYSPQFEITREQSEQPQKLTNVGCILYQSMTDGKDHHTWFIATISMVDEKSGKPPLPGKGSPIKFSDRPSEKKLCVIDVLFTGIAD